MGRDRPRFIFFQSGSHLGFHRSDVYIYARDFRLRVRFPWPFWRPRERPNTRQRSRIINFRLLSNVVTNISDLVSSDSSNQRIRKPYQKSKEIPNIWILFRNAIDKIIKKKKNYKKFEMIARKKKMNIWKYMIFPSLEKIHEDI